MKSIYRMSSAGYCPRALSAEHLGYKPEPKPPWLETSAIEGKWHEERAVKELESESYAVFDRQQEVRLDYLSFILLGHIDGKVKHDSKTMLLEIKSMSQYEFDRWMKGKFNEFPEYADQITCYMTALDISECLYWVKNRSSGYVDRQIITAPADINSIAEVLDAVEQSVQRKQLVHIECDMFTLECKRCSYKYLCVKTKEDMSLQDEKVLSKAAENWRKGKQLSSEGKELIDSAKEIFEEHTIASGLPQWNFDNLVITNVTVKEHEVPARIQKESSYIKINDIRKEE
jgi:hypothetical protein